MGDQRNQSRVWTKQAEEELDLGKNLRKYDVDFV